MFEIDTYHNFAWFMVILITIYAVILYFILWKKVESDTWCNIFFFGTLFILFISVLPVSQNIIRPEIENIEISNIDIKSCDNTGIMSCNILIKNKEHNINKIELSDTNETIVFYKKYKKNIFSNNINEEYSLLKLNKEDYKKYIE